MSLPTTTVKRQVDIDFRQTDPDKKGLITYHYNEPSEPKGLFSFTWYYRHKPTTSNRNITSSTSIANEERLLKYSIGLELYLQIIAVKFPNWKIVIYTDQDTLEGYQNVSNKVKQRIDAILTDPNTILATCSWPEYYTGSPEGDHSKKIDNVIFRIFRNRAFCDFNAVPVLVRDADTIFDLSIYKPITQAEINKYADWEHICFSLHQTTGKPFLVTSTLTYNRQWHTNSKYNFPSMGFFAGVTNKLEYLEQWNPSNPDNLWLKSLDFIRPRSYVILETQQLVNLHNPSYIGKDEQVIFFVWLPELVDETFFLMLNISKEPTTSLEYLNKEDDRFLKRYFNGILTNLMNLGVPQQKLRKEYGPTPNQLHFSLDTNANPPMGTPPLGPTPTFNLPPNLDLSGKETASTKVTPSLPLEYLRLRNRYQEAINEGVLNGPLNFSSLERNTVKDGLYRIHLDKISPFFMEQAFREPVYDLVLRTMFKKLYNQYLVYKQQINASSLTSGASQGGNRKRNNSKKTRKRKGVKTSKRTKKSRQK